MTSFTFHIVDVNLKLSNRREQDHLVVFHLQISSSIYFVNLASTCVTYNKNELESRRMSTLMLWLSSCESKSLVTSRKIKKICAESSGFGFANWPQFTATISSVTTKTLFLLIIELKIFFSSLTRKPYLTLTHM